MNTRIRKFLAAALACLAFTVSVHASQLYFSAAQGTGTQYPQTIGYISIDNPTYSSTAWWVNPPASALAMIFNHEDTALFQATVDTDYSTGNHHIGQFLFGADCYVWIY